MHNDVARGATVCRKQMSSRSHSNSSEQQAPDCGRGREMQLLTTAMEDSAVDDEGITAC